MFVQEWFDTATVLSISLLKNEEMKLSSIFTLSRTVVSNVKITSILSSSEVTLRRSKQNLTTYLEYL